MTTHTITVHHEIDMAHRVVGHSGKCRRLHGHRWQFDILIGGSALSDIGFLVDFGVVKEVVNRWDHRLLLWESDPCVVDDVDAPEGEPQEDIEEALGVVRVPLNPTSENLGILMHVALTDALPDEVSWVEVTVRETPSTSSRYGGDA